MPQSNAAQISHSRRPSPSQNRAKVVRPAHSCPANIILLPHRPARQPPSLQPMPSTTSAQILTAAPSVRT